MATRQIPDLAPPLGKTGLQAASLVGSTKNATGSHLEVMKRVKEHTLPSWGVVASGTPEDISAWIEQHKDVTR